MPNHHDSNQDSNQDTNPNTNNDDDTPEERDDIAELFGDESQEFIDEDDADGEDLFGDDMER